MLRPALVLLLGLCAACAGGGRAFMEERPVTPGEIEADLRRLVLPAADSAAAARRARYAAAELRAAGLMPALASSYLVGSAGAGRPPAGGRDPARAHVLGYVPGRDPGRATRLVLVAADLDAPGAAAALAAARRLAAAARYTQVPERSVLFALWGPPRTGATGLRDYLANPTWAPAHIERVLLVTSDTAGMAAQVAFLEGEGLAAEVVTVAEATVDGPETTAASAQARAVIRAVRLAEALDARLRAVTVAP